MFVNKGSPLILIDIEVGVCEQGLHLRGSQPGPERLHRVPLCLEQKEEKSQRRMRLKNFGQSFKILHERKQSYHVIGNITYLSYLHL